jgi:hypothetical protein
MSRLKRILYDARQHNLALHSDVTTQSFTTREFMPKEKREVKKHVNLKDIPVWFRQRVRKFLKGESRYSIKDNARLSLQKLGILLDHWGTIENGTILVSEPYLRIEDDTSKAKAYAESIHCDLVVSAESEWYPPSTIRLAFLPRPLFERLLDPKVIVPLSEYDPSRTSREPKEK